MDAPSSGLVPLLFISCTAPLQFNDTRSGTAGRPEKFDRVANVPRTSLPKLVSNSMRRPERRPHLVGADPLHARLEDRLLGGVQLVGGHHRLQDVVLEREETRCSCHL